MKSNQYYKVASVEWMRLAKLGISYSQSRHLRRNIQEIIIRFFSTVLKLVSSLYIASGILYMSGPRDLEETPRVIWNIAAVFRLELQYVQHIASDPYRAWTRPFESARAERTDVITRGDNRHRRGTRGRKKKKPRADTINKSFFNAGSAMDLRDLTPAMDVLGW